MVLSVMLLAAYFIETYFIMSGAIRTTDPQNLLLIGSAAGSVQTLAGVIVTFWFGSSKSSADKDQTISALSAPQPSLPVAGVNPGASAS